ncbi:hypothetical protein HBB16_13240 [Pseudonocardia sp. MCCB 268]|nr:hypothetical protein [Pseudonocardia cytotoxica]
MRADIDGGLAAVADAALRRQEHRAPAAIRPAGRHRAGTRGGQRRESRSGRARTSPSGQPLPDYLGVPDGRDVAVLCWTSSPTPPWNCGPGGGRTTGP